MRNPLDGLVTRIADAAADRVTASVTEAAEQKLYTMESMFLSGAEVALPDVETFFGNAESGAYSASWVAYSCIRRQALDVSGVPILFLRSPDDQEDERNRLDKSHPKVALLNNPNPYFDLTEFMQSIVTMLLLRGEFFIVPDSPERPTSLVQYTDPKHWKEHTTGADLAMWEYRHNAQAFTRLPHEILHHRFIDPGNPFRGQAPIKAAAVANDIEVGGDKLKRNILRRGGEKPVLIQADQSASKVQGEKLKAAIAARRGRGYASGREIIFPHNFKPLESKFLDEDLSILEQQGQSVDKVCAVYGMSKSLLGMEDIDKYATFEGRMRVYWLQQLVPLLHGIERAFDRFFAGDLTRQADRCYMRFDLSSVKSLQSNLAERFEMAGKAHKDGIPWDVLNERFSLGLNTELIPASDTVLVSATLVPTDKLVEMWDDGGPAAEGSASQGDDKRAAMASPAVKRNAEIRRKATDPRRTIQRNIRLGKLEKKARSGWRSILGKYKGKVAKASEGAAPTASGQRSALKKALKGLGRGLVEMLGPIHVRAASEGMLAIQDIAGKSVSGADYDAFIKAPILRDEMTEAIRRRQNRILAMEEDLFDDLISHAESAVIDGAGQQEITTLVRGRMNVRIGRAITIARTEVGSAYSTARYVETKEQEFKKTMWLTAADEVVRGEDADDEFDHSRCNEEVQPLGDKFSCGLLYPMEEGGDASNVINCRCEAIPYESEN